MSRLIVALCLGLALSCRMPPVERCQMAPVTWCADEARGDGE